MAPVFTLTAGFETDDPLYQTCRALPGVTEDIKWGDNFVFSVGKKMFAIFHYPGGEPFSLKVSQHAFADLTNRPGIIPAPYLARHSWVRVNSRQDLPQAETQFLLREAHALVAARLSKKKRMSLGIEE